MSLDLLEKKLSEAECTYTRKPDGTIVMPCEGKYTVHPIMIEQDGGHMRASVHFPIPMVESVQELCVELNRFLHKVDDTTALLADSNRVLSLSVRTTYAEIEESLQVLGIFADDFYSIFEYLHEYGQWDTNLLGLAFLDPEDCEGHA